MGSQMTQEELIQLRDLLYKAQQQVAKDKKLSRNSVIAITQIKTYAGGMGIEFSCLPKSAMLDTEVISNEKSELELV
jgi:hypothetical protein